MINPLRKVATSSALLLHNHSRKGMIPILSDQTTNLDRPGYGLEGEVTATLRHILLAILFFSMTGTFADLLFMDHYQDWWQLIPLALLVCAVVAILYYGVSRSAAALRGVQVVMVLFLAAGIAGVVLHFRASATFHSDMDSTIGGWRLIELVLGSKAPPTLAPMTMLQMGLIGLAFTYRHPLLSRQRPVATEKEN